MFGEIWQPCAMRVFGIGAQVEFPGAHGHGVVVGYNTNSGFYTGRRYPYVVTFDDGYTDVYCSGSIQAVPALPAPQWVKCYQMCVEEDHMCFPWSERVCGTCPNWEGEVVDVEADQYDKLQQDLKEVI